LERLTKTGLVSQNVDWAQFCNKLGIIDVKRTSVASMAFLDNGDSQTGENLGFEKVASLGLGCSGTISRRGTYRSFVGVSGKGLSFSDLRGLVSGIPTNESGAGDTVIECLNCMGRERAG
jgi:hypothetical protein